MGGRRKRRGSGHGRTAIQSSRLWGGWGGGWEEEEEQTRTDGDPVIEALGRWEEEEEGRTTIQLLRPWGDGLEEEEKEE